jgi:hypothetical protein
MSPVTTKEPVSIPTKTCSQRLRCAITLCANVSFQKDGFCQKLDRNISQDFASRLSSKTSVFFTLSMSVTLGRRIDACQLMIFMCFLILARHLHIIKTTKFLAN